jgi:CheY-like chemotaxis protein
MPDGGELALRTGETEQGEVLIEVKDSGEGIRREDISRLTDAFFTTRPDRRMGLGLHLVQMFIERHAGRLDVRSTRGGGSTFCMILPASDEAPEEPAPPLRPDLLARNSGPTVPEPARPRTRGGRSILLIDDQADLVQVVRTILESRGFSVDAALSGREGVALAEASRYSLVLTDLGMPDTSGWEVAQRVLEVQPKTPVILMTGWAADIDEARLRESRIEALLPKPFRSEQLLQLVTQVLETSSGGSG